MKKLFVFSWVLLIVLASCRVAPVPTPVPPTATPPPPTATSSPTASPTQVDGNATVELGDITMYFQAHGEGESVILLHGGMASSEAWSNQIPVFSQQYRVIAPDSRGQGRTTDSDMPISYHLMAEDTVRLMDHLGIDSAYIVGWSDGANTGIDLAIHHPERVKALVAYGGNISPEGMHPDFSGWLNTAPEAELYAALGEEYLALSSTPEHLPVLADKMKAMWQTEPKFTAAELGSIKVPTLVIDGENEEFVTPGHPESIAQAIPGSELILLEDVGHFALNEKPNEWNKAVLNFLENH